MVERAFGAAFLKFCRSAESIKIPEVAARLFLELFLVVVSAHDFAWGQARTALDVFLSDMEAIQKRQANAIMWPAKNGSMCWLNPRADVMRK